MIYRALGKTEPNVSILGFGASPSGHKFGIINEAEGTRAVHLAIDKGTNYFDVSPYYGRTLAEERLGAVLEKPAAGSPTGAPGKEQTSRNWPSSLPWTTHRQPSPWWV